MKGSSAKAMSPGKTGLGGVETTLNPLHDRDFRVEGFFSGVGWGGSFSPSSSFILPFWSLGLGPSPYLSPTPTPADRLRAERAIIVKRKRYRE